MIGNKLDLYEGEEGAKQNIINNKIKKTANDDKKLDYKYWLNKCVGVDWFCTQADTKTAQTWNTAECTYCTICKYIRVENTTMDRPTAYQ